MIVSVGLSGQAGCLSHTSARLTAHIPVGSDLDRLAMLFNVSANPSKSACSPEILPKMPAIVGMMPSDAIISQIFGLLVWDFVKQSIYAASSEAALTLFSCLIRHGVF